MMNPVIACWRMHGSNLPGPSCRLHHRPLNSPLNPFACSCHEPLHYQPLHPQSGKYLNVIRECGQQVPPCPDTTLTQLRFDAAAAERGSPPFLAGIQAALSAAAGALLAHMTGPQGRMLCWLHCLKHFFLLDQVGVGVGVWVGVGV